MEQWKADLIDRIKRESTLSSYGLSIRLQQQFGMSWREATTIAGYDDSPHTVYTPKPEPPPYIPTSEEVAERKRRAQEYEERLILHKERLKKDPAERMHELVDQMKVKDQLIAIKDNLLKGVGEVDQEPTIIIDHSPPIGSGEYKGYGVSYSSNPPRIGVLMLRVPCQARVYLDALGTTRDYEDFASVRVGIYLPHLPNDRPATYEADDVERIGVQVRPSNLKLYSSMPPDSPVSNQWLWHYWGEHAQHSFGLKNKYPQYPSPNQLNTLLMYEIKKTPITSFLESLPPPIQPSQPIKQDQPWYRRFFG